MYYLCSLLGLTIQPQLILLAMVGAGVQEKISIDFIDICV